MGLKGGSSVVKAVDIESLFQKYLDEKNLEKCDALYLLYTEFASDAAKTLRIRYGRSGAISSVLDDLREAGIQKIDQYEWTEDTKEQVETVVQEFFKRNCVGLVLESAREKANSLSQLAREWLYLISALDPKSLGNSKILRDFYQILFQKEISGTDFENVLEELCSCYVTQRADYLEAPPYLDDLLYELRDFMPEVEVKVSWRME